MESSIKVFSRARISHWIIGSLVKNINIWGNFIWKCHLIPCYPCSLTQFFIFLINNSIWYHFLYFALKCFSSFNSLVPLPFLPRYYIRWYNSNGGNCEVMNSSHHDKIIISENVAILLSSMWFILIVLPHYKASYYTHFFLSPNFEKIRIFWERWNNLQNQRISSLISFIKWSITLCDIAGLQQQKQWNLFFSWKKLASSTDDFHCSSFILPT